MEQDFLATVAKEGSNPFATLEKETPTESPAETKPEADKPVEGEHTPDDNLPFHKHPRWIERETELQSLRERDEERAKEIADLKAFKEESTKRNAPLDTKIPDWFKELYGENEVAWQKYSERELVREQEIERRLIERQETAQRQQAEEATHWNKWVDKEIGKLEADGHVFDRNKLIQTMLKVKPTDDDGNLDFKAGLEVYNLQEAAAKHSEIIKSDARKELADTTTRSTSRGDKPKKDYMTPADLRGKSWSNII